MSQPLNPHIHVGVEVPAEAKAKDLSREQEAEQKRQLLVRAGQYGYAVGIPVAAALCFVRLEDRAAQLEARTEQLERKVAALQGPPHLSKIEKR
jgi:hypothetical protein